MATHIPQRDLRNNPGEILARVEAGEALTITVRGRAVADLVPTRETARRPLTVREFTTGIRGMLASQDDLMREVRAKDDLARDPFERGSA